MGAAGLLAVVPAVFRGVQVVLRGRRVVPEAVVGVVLMVVAGVVNQKVTVEEMVVISMRCKILVVVPATMVALPLLISTTGSTWFAPTTSAAARHAPSGRRFPRRFPSVLGCPRPT